MINRNQKDKPSPSQKAAVQFAAVTALSGSYPPLPSSNEWGGVS